VLASAHRDGSAGQFKDQFVNRLHDGCCARAVIGTHRQKIAHTATEAIRSGVRIAMTRIRPAVVVWRAPKQAPLAPTASDFTIAPQAKRDDTRRRSQ